MTVAKPPALLRSRPFWLGMAVAAGAGLAYLLHNRDELDFWARLYNAKALADKFYTAYPFLTKDIAYGSGRAQKLDVYRPKIGAGLPVLVYVHGGSWSSGNKRLYAPMAQRLLPQGMLVVIVGYTLYPHATCRQQVGEAALALAWVLDNIAHFGGDPRRIFVAAQSSGAQISALAMVDPAWLATHGHRAAEIAGFIGISGVYDIAAQAEFSRSSGYAGNFFGRFFGDSDSFGPASPLMHVRPGLPPSLLIHGDADRTVPFVLSEAYHDALIAAGNRSRYLIYSRSGHAQILFDALAENPSRLLSDIVSFVRSSAATA